MSNLTIDVQGMSCDHCVNAVTGAVNDVPGVHGVQVDLAAGSVTVTGDGVDAAAVRDAITEAGYEPVG